MIDTKMLDLKRELWPAEDCRKVLKCAEIFDRRGVMFQVTCKTCQQILEAGEPEPDGMIVLVCGCTRRVMEELRVKVVGHGEGM